jgi:hypothetical protein
MSVQSLQERLRELGYKLATAERYGTSKDISGMQQAHRVLLRKFYNGAVR